MNQSITNKVAAFLIDPNHTKKGLAAALGMSVTTLNNRLSGKHPWMWPEVKTLAQILGCSTNDFV